MRPPFILSQTFLESLEIKRCSLDIKVSERIDGEDEDEDNDEDEDDPPRMWSDILDGFGKAMKKLNGFKFTSPFAQVFTAL